MLAEVMLFELCSTTLKQIQLLLRMCIPCVNAKHKNTYLMYWLINNIVFRVQTTD